ncbi:MAG: hypothetical protein ACUVUQ_11670 [Thermodesulfovibrionales bacterium]
MKEKFTIEQIEQVHALLLKHNTSDEISKLLNLPVNTVRKIVARYFPHLKDVTLFSEHKKDIFKGLQSLATGYLIQKMPYASFKDLVDLVKMLEEKVALLEGRSTSNIGIALRIEDLVAKKEEMLNDLRNRGVPENRIEIEFQKLTALPSAGTIPAPTIAAPEQDKSFIKQQHLF